MTKDVLGNFLASQSYQEEFKELMASLQKKYGKQMIDECGIGKQLDTNAFAKNFFKEQQNTADASVDANSNVSLKNIIVFDEELTKPLKLIYSYYRLWKGLKKRYGLEYANKAVEKQVTGEIYINDFHGFSTNKYYSYYGKTVITIKYKNQVKTINMEELFEMFSDLVVQYPDRETADLTNVNIYVLDKGNKFVKLTHVLRHKPHNELLKIETKNGMTTIVTEDHPIILEDGLEKFAQDIVKGDRIMMSDCKYEIFDSKNHNIDRTKYLIGFIIGDGCLLKGGNYNTYQVAIAQKDIENHKVYQYICEESPNTANTINKHKNREDMVTFGDKCWVCKNAQIKKGAPNKVLPSDILNWDRNEILSLIAGLIDSDGCVNPQNGVIDIRICGFSVVQQVAEILRSLGFERVRTSHMTVQKRMGSFGSNFDLYRVSFVTDDEDLIKFSDKLSANKELVTKERGIDGRFNTNEVLKILPMQQEKPEYVYDITTETGHFHSQGMIQHNCYNYSTLDTAMNGIPKGLDAEESTPTKYLNTFFEHLQLFCVQAGASSLGAVGLADLLLTVSAYADRILTLKSDQHVNFVSTEDCWTFIKEKLTNFIYFLNQPNRIIQSLFSNVSIYDGYFIDSLIDHYQIMDEDNNIWKAKKENVIKIQEIFLEAMNEIMSKRLITFPVLTACFSLDDDRNILDEDFLKYIMKINNKYCMINFYGGKTSSLSSCCFDGSQMVLTKSSEGGIKLCPIKEVVDGAYKDYRNNFTVFHNGSWVHAKAVKLPKEGHRMFKVITANKKEMILTDNHLNLTMRGDVSTDKLTTDDYIAFNARSLDTYPEADRKLTYEQGIFIGAYLGDGSKYKHKDCESYQTTFSLSEGKLHLLDKFAKALKDWDIKANITVHDGQHSVKFVNICSKDAFDTINDYVVGNYAPEKGLNPIVFSQSREFRRGILDGLYATDGGNCLRIYSTSTRLIQDMEALCTTLGINTCVNVDTRRDTEIRGEKINKNYDVLCLRWYDPKNKRGMGEDFKVINNTEYFKVKSIEEVETTDDYVYCFEMKNQDEPYFTLPNGIITHNCRLRSDKDNKYFQSSLSGTGTKIGSLGVCTMNLPRLAYLSKGDIEKFKEMIHENVILGQRINNVKRGILKKAIEKKMIPMYNLGYTLLETQYSTMGINGLYEALEILGYNIVEDDGLKFTEDLLDQINIWNDEIGDKLKAPVNLEQIPAENVSVKLAKKDRMLGYNDKYEIYSNQFIPLTYTGIGSDLLTKVRLQGALDKRFSGGSILHININENGVTEDTLGEIVKNTFKSGTVYFAFNKLISICKDCGKVFTSNKVDFDNLDIHCSCGSNNIENALRIVGFIRKFSSYSKERKEESRKRVFYNV